MLDLSPKQQISLNESNARINIWEGAVRSGKSYSSLIRWLEYIQEAPPGNLVMVGRTATTIKHNLVDEICNLLGTDARYYSGKNELNLWGKRIYLVGASDARSEQKIRGATFSGAYVDEATLIPEAFWTMLLSRLSVPNSKIFTTTNPDSPFHWLKKNYIDRIDELDMKRWKFYLEDNPSLSEEFKISLKQEYRGLWYRRYIDGEWCLAEGTIYDFFDEAIHCIDFPPGQGKEYYVGIDYGTTNPCAFVLLGYNPMNYPNMWVEKEYYYDSAKHSRQKTDTEYAQDLAKFIEGIPISGIYVDPAAASFKLECSRQSIRNVFDANNDVLDGIRFVAGLFTNGTLKICKSCRNLIREMGAYVWDPKSKDLGVDKPLKANDHCFSEGTPIATHFGQRPIERVMIGDMVLTPIGYKYVIETFENESEVYEYEVLGQKIKCTPNHKFFTINGWKEARSLIQSDMFLIKTTGETCLRKSSYLTESSTDGTYPPRIFPIEDISEHIKQIALKDAAISIEMYGNSIMEKYPQDVIFITSMEIPRTMTLATSSIYQLASTYPNIWQIVQKNKLKLQEFIAKKLDRLQKNGTDQKKEENGIKNTELKHIKKENQRNINVSNAIKNSNQQNTQTQNFVQITVNHNGVETIKLMMRQEYVRYVVKNIELINTQKQKHVQRVAESFIGKQKVYNLHVEDMNVYYANDILVLNCNDSLRYCLHTVFGQTLGNQDRMTKEKLDSLKRKVQSEWY